MNWTHLGLGCWWGVADLGETLEYESFLSLGAKREESCLIKLSILSTKLFALSRS